MTRVTSSHAHETRSCSVELAFHCQRSSSLYDLLLLDTQRLLQSYHKRARLERHGATRKGLHVSEPRGDQRSTYSLSLLYSWAAPLPWSMSPFTGFYHRCSSLFVPMPWMTLEKSAMIVLVRLSVHWEILHIHSPRRCGSLHEHFVAHIPRPL